MSRFCEPSILKVWLGSSLSEGANLSCSVVFFVAYILLMTKKRRNIPDSWREEKGNRFPPRVSDIKRGMIMRAWGRVGGWRLWGREGGREERILAFFSYLM